MSWASGSAKSHRCKSIVLFFLCLLTMLTPQADLSAANTVNVDPDSVQQEFEGTGLLNYLAASLESILANSTDDMIAMLGALEYSSVPINLVPATNAFTHSVLSLTLQVSLVDSDLILLSKAVDESRLVEASERLSKILAQIKQAYSLIDDIEATSLSIGKTMDVGSNPKESKIQSAYRLLLGKIELLRRSLDLHIVRLMSLIEELNSAVAIAQAGSISHSSAGTSVQTAIEALSTALKPGANIQKQITKAQDSLTQYGSSLNMTLKRTELSLIVAPISAFVGDTVSVQGVLTSNQLPLAFQEIVVLLDSAPALKTTTDYSGHYELRVPLPLQYSPEINIQTKFSPSAPDALIFSSASSQTITVELRYYTGDLIANWQGKAFPGRTGAISGSFTYESAPDLLDRTLEIYLDTVYIAEATLPKMFLQNVFLAPNTTVGRHILRLYAPGSGRYAPINATIYIEVTQSVLALNIHLPRLIFFPYKAQLSGTIGSEFGPLPNVEIAVLSKESQVNTFSNQDGSFAMSFKTSTTWSVVSSPIIYAHFNPTEPWVASTVVVIKPLIINLVNLAIIMSLAVFFFVGFRRGWWYRIKFNFKTPVDSTPSPKSDPEGIKIGWTAKNNEPTKPLVSTEGQYCGQDHHLMILDKYRDALQLVQKLTGLVLTPEQTLSEFARQANRSLGEAGVPFKFLTEMTEMIMYSCCVTSEEDAERSSVLSNSIKGSLARENT